MSGGYSTAPSRQPAGALGFCMLVVAAAIGVWIGIGYNGTVYPLTLTIAGCAFICCVVAFTGVRCDGEVAHHG